LRSGITPAQVHEDVKMTWYSKIDSYKSLKGIFKPNFDPKNVEITRSHLDLSNSTFGVEFIIHNLQSEDFMDTIKIANKLSLSIGFYIIIDSKISGWRSEEFCSIEITDSDIKYHPDIAQDSNILQIMCGDLSLKVNYVSSNIVSSNFFND
jgi:hypothetical protein